MSEVGSRDVHFMVLRECRYSFEDKSHGMIDIYLIKGLLTMGMDPVSRIWHAIEALIADPNARL